MDVSASVFLSLFVFPCVSICLVREREGEREGERGCGIWREGERMEAMG